MCRRNGARGRPGHPAVAQAFGWVDAIGSGPGGGPKLNVAVRESAGLWPPAATAGGGRKPPPPPTKNAPARVRQGVLEDKWGGVLLSHPVSRAVPSALEGLTSLFGMGRGVSPPPKPPQFEFDNRYETRVHTLKRLSKTGQASRLISTDRLKLLRVLHLPPIDVVISDEPS